MRPLIALLVLFSGLMTWALVAGERPADADAIGGTDVAEVMAEGPTEGYARATEVPSFRWPADHGSHPEYRNEWWYLTGNLQASSGERFGLHVTFFRSSLTPEPRERGSAWGSSQLYMAHLAISDLDGKRYLHAERFARGALGLAGATLASELEPDGVVQVWLRDWRMTIQGNERPTLTLLADAPADDKHPAFGVDLRFDSSKPVVLNGDRGLSQKGSQEGNASLYYALTRLATKGQLTIGDQRFTITGDCWLDREWSTSALEKGQQGWDWFALQLDDGRDLMLYQLRDADGKPGPTSSGTLTDAQGHPRHLKLADFTIEPTSSWTSPRGGTYPAAWRLRVPSEKIDLIVRPALADQELVSQLVRYWEGAVIVSGSATGRGYTELVGYAEDQPRRGD